MTTNQESNKLRLCILWHTILYFDTRLFVFQLNIFEFSQANRARCQASVLFYIVFIRNIFDDEILRFIAYAHRFYEAYFEILLFNHCPLNTFAMQKLAIPFYLDKCRSQRSYQTINFHVAAHIYDASFA